MKQNVGKIAVEGKHIIKNFQIGSTITKVLRIRNWRRSLPHSAGDWTWR